MKKTNRRYSLRAALLAGSLVLAGCANDQLAVFGADATANAPIDALMRAGDLKYDEGDYRSAATLYRSAYDSAPDDQVLPALLGLGRSLAATGAPQEAAEVYREALNVDPENAEALRGIANAMVSIGQPALALPYYDRAWAAAPNDWRVDLGHGVALDLLGQHSAAQSRYRDGLAKQPTQPDLRSNLGLSLALTGNIDNALTLLKPLLGANGTEARHRQTLAMVHGLAGDQTSAREIASIDLTPRAIEQNLAFYETIRKMEDPTKRLKAIRAHMAQ